MQTLPELFRSNRGGNFPRSIVEEFNQLQRQLDRLTRQVPESFSNFVFPVVDETFEPALEVEDKDSHYVLSFDLPGVKKEDIRIALENNVLTISAERKSQSEKRRKGQYQSRQFYGSYERSFTLPPEVKGNQIESDYHDGVLRLAVPKPKASQIETIKIGENKAGILNQLSATQKKLN